MKKKKIVIGSLLIVFLFLMLPSVSAIQFSTNEETIKSYPFEKMNIPPYIWFAIYILILAIANRLINSEIWRVFIKVRFGGGKKLEIKQNHMIKLMDFIFICSAIIFNISVSLVYLATKFDNNLLLQVSDSFVIVLIVPFSVTLYGYIKKEAERKIIIPHIAILFYLFLELLLDYILKIPFRDILTIHIPYIIVFYAAEFSMIGVSFERNRKMGVVVLLTFLILLCCLVYLYVG